MPVTASQTTDNPTATQADAGEERVAATHFVIGALFLALGGLLQALALFTLRFGDIPGLGYGRLEAMANLTLMLGFAVISLVGGVYYVLPRLTGTRLASPNMARLAMLALAALVVAGLVLIGFGFGSGRQPFSLPWWMHLPVALALAVPAVIAFRTVTSRREVRSYVTLWFVLGGVTWLPLLYLAYFMGEIPGLGSLAVAYSDLFFSAGFVTMFVFTVGTGLFYYTLVKEVEIPLASRSLANIGFWSLGFAAVWWGVAQLVFGPGPSWVAGVAAALGLAFPIGALANAANVSITLEGHWEELGEKPGLVSGVVGLYLGVAVALMASFASFPSIGAATALTEYWEAIEYASILGVGVLLVGATSIHALPRLVGRRIHSLDRVRTFNRLTLIGVGGVLITMAATGLVKGYSWIGGSNSGSYVDVGEGWGAGSASTVEALLLLAFGFGVIAFLGQLAYVSVILGTITTGKATTQEVLVEVEADDG